MRRIGLASLVLLIAGAFAAFGQATGTGRGARGFELAVNANVKGASVFVAGQAKGQAPYKETLAPATYEVKVTAPGYVDWVQNVNLDKATTLEVALVLATFRLTVNANAKGATVTVNNVAKGAAGYAEDLAPGTYAVVVAAPGYDAYSETVTLNKPTTVTANLKLSSFRLTVNANVKGATVTVNNVAKGAAGYAEDLAPGTYAVVVAAPGYDSYTESVNLNKPTTVTANLKLTTFRLTVNANVKGAAVSVNNVAKGAAGYAEDLAPGAYAVTVTAEGYQPFSQNVTLDRATTITATLQPAMATLVLPAQYLEGDAQFVKVYLDGKLMNAQIAVKGSIQVPPGKHKIRLASAPAGLATEAEFDFAAGQSYEMRLQLQFVVPGK